MASNTARLFAPCRHRTKTATERFIQTAYGRCSHTSVVSRRHHSNIPRNVALSKTTILIGQDGIDAETTTPRDNRRITKALHFFNKCEFLYSAAELRQHPLNDHTVPEILVLGASNVGKSSLINGLFNRKDMARASKEPGKTTLMNAYGVGQPLSLSIGPVKNGPKPPKHGLILMDTPGYGFGSRTEWGQNILTYIEKRKALRGAMLLVSAEKKLTEEDRWILEQLASASTRVIVVLTRVDKLRGRWEETCSQMGHRLKEVAEDLERSLSLKFPVDIYAVSAHSAGDGTRGGIGGLRPAILDMAGIHVGETKVEQTKENVQYTGKIVSFDDIQWKV